MLKSSNVSFECYSRWDEVGVAPEIILRLNDRVVVAYFLRIACIRAICASPN